MEAVVNKPKYLRCRDEILRLAIELGLSEGDAIPSINQLIEKLGTVRTNVQNAINQLCREGVLDKRPGSGCYLRKTPGQRKQSAPDYPVIDYLSGPVSIVNRKTLKIGVLQELRCYPGMWQSLIDSFSNASGIRVEPVHADSITELLAQSPDIFQIPDYMLADIAGRGILLSLEELNTTFNSVDFIPAAESLISYKNRLWGVPMVCGCGCIFFNREVLGLEHTLRSASDITQLLEKFSSTPPPPPSTAWSLNCYLLSDYLKFSGISTHRNSGDMLAAFSKPETAAFLSGLEPFFRNHKIFHGQSTKAFSQSLPLFKNRHVVSIMGNSSIMLQAFTNSSFPVGIAAPPLSANGSGELVSFINVVSSSTSRQGYCAEFLKFIAEEETQRQFAAQGRLVAHSRALESLRIPFTDDASTRALAAAIRASSPTMLDHKEHGERLIPQLLRLGNDWQLGIISLQQFIKSMQSTI